MKYMLNVSITVVILGAIVFLTREPILFVFGDFLVIKDTLQQADAIHVISGPDNTRIDYAIQLYQQGFARKIIFTGGWCDCTGSNSAEYGQRRARQQGVPIEAIIVDGSQVTSTYAEIGRLKEIVTHSPIPVHSIIGVSDPYHMWRSRWTYQEVLGDQISIQMAPVPFNLSPYKRRWWTDEASRRYVKDEYFKIGYYFARYKFGWGPLGEWLASLDRE